MRQHWFRFDRLLCTERGDRVRMRKIEERAPQPLRRDPEAFVYGSGDGEIVAKRGQQLGERFARDRAGLDRWASLRVFCRAEDFVASSIEQRRPRPCVLPRRGPQHRTERTNSNDRPTEAQR